MTTYWPWFLRRRVVCRRKSVEDQDWTAADISAEVKAFRDMQMRGSRTRTGQSHDDALAEFRRLYPRMASLLDQASPS